MTAWVDGMARIDQDPDGAALVAVISQGCGSDYHLGRSRALLPLLAVRPGERVLEVGCGAGATLRELARQTDGRAFLLGTDPSALMLAQAVLETAEMGSRPAPIKYARMDGTDLAVPDDAFDAVYCSRVLTHAADPPAIVAEMARVVRSGGCVLAIEPATNFAAGVDDALRERTAGFTNRTIGRELVGLMRAAGLVDVAVTPYAQVNLDPPDVAAMRAGFREGRDLRAAAVRDGRCPAAEVELAFDQLEESIARGAYCECQLHFAALARKP